MRLLISTLQIFLLVVAAASPTWAIDVVVRKGGTERDGGKITKISKTEVIVTKQVGGDTTIPVNTIAWIEFDGAPAAMGLGRSALEGGQLDVAQKQLEQAQKEAASSDNAGLQGDLAYLLARVFAQRAMTDPAQAAEASKRLQDFISKNRDHYRLYDAQLLLGDVSLVSGDHAAAVSAYTSVGTAPWKDYQLAAQIGQGRTALAQNNVDAAQREFDAVAGVTPSTPAESSRRLQGMLGQARCLTLKGQHDKAIQTLDTVINESKSGDARLQAEAYLLQGDCYTASGASPKEAIMAYLHVDVIPSMSRESDLHAQALYHLARLWNQVGQQDRAREAADALTGQYPDSEWAKKLAG